MAYCTIVDIQAILGIPAYTSFLDDDEDGVVDAIEEGYATAAIARAASLMDSFLLRKYSESALTGNAWCRYCNAVLAAFYITTRSVNPNPNPLTPEYDMYLNMLKDISECKMDLPGADTLSILRPSVSNYFVRNRAGTRDYTQNPIVVEIPNSTGDTPPAGVKRPL